MKVAAVVVAVAVRDADFDVVPTAAVPARMVVALEIGNGTTTGIEETTVGEGTMTGTEETTTGTEEANLVEETITGTQETTPGIEEATLVEEMTTGTEERTTGVEEATVEFSLVVEGAITVLLVTALVVETASEMGMAVTTACVRVQGQLDHNFAVSIVYL